MLEPELLILGEPTEGIQLNIVQEIRDTNRRLSRDLGLTVLLVEQKLPLARRVADGFHFLSKGRSVAEVADGLGVNANMLSRWKTELESEGGVAFPGNGKGTGTDEEVRRLRRELATAQQERDILRKAVAFFAKAKS